MNEKGAAGMKSAIVTIYGEQNYGNRLQNYAVYTVLRQMGIPCETVARLQRISQKAKAKKAVKQLLLPLGILPKGTQLRAKREKAFLAFTKKHIPTRYVITDNNRLPDNIAREYDYFVIGSDQVWNPTFGGFENQFWDMFLLFAKPKQKICFSPSIGVSKLPTQWESKFREAWMTFPEINVREEAGANLISQMTGKDVGVTIDPTLMLTAKQWSAVAQPVPSVDGCEYILEYFLGDMSQEENRETQDYADQNHYKRIRLLDARNPEIYVSGPAEFLTLIKNAKLVITDSFHACVFSIIFGKPFVIHKRQDNTQDMYSRIHTLCNLFGLDGQTASIDNPLVVSEEYRDKKLEEERKKLHNYLGKMGDKA